MSPSDNPLLNETPTGGFSVLPSFDQLSPALTAAHTQKQINAAKRASRIVSGDFECDADVELFNNIESQLGVALAEQPWHRTAIFMKATGMSNVKIAERLDKTPEAVSTMLRQPWARAILLKEINDAGRDRVSQILNAEVENSLFTLVEIRDDIKQPGAVRKAAASDLLDRHLGKPAQTVKTQQLPDATPAELQKIEAELAAVRQITASIIPQTVEGTRKN